MPRAHFALHFRHDGFLLNTALSPSSFMVNFGSSFHHGWLQILPLLWWILNPLLISVP
ncbi:unnamed protein product [Musa acuminata subsp. burmannicoides]